MAGMRELALEGEFFGRLEAGVEPPGRAQPVLRRGIAGEALRLPDEGVPAEPEPAEILLDRQREFLGRAFAVGVVEPQKEAAAGAPGEEPVDERRPDIAEVQPPGRARREADPRSPAGARSR